MPLYSPDGENHGTSAAIEYATKNLKVQHLIVLGHRDCGGIKSGHSLHSNNLNPDYEFINKWLSILLPAFNKVKKDVSEKNPGQWLLKSEAVMEIEGVDKPAYVAETLSMFIT